MSRAREELDSVPRNSRLTRILEWTKNGHGREIEFGAVDRSTDRGFATCPIFLGELSRGRKICRARESSNRSSLSRGRGRRLVKYSAKERVCCRFSLSVCLSFSVSLRTVALFSACPGAGKFAVLSRCARGKTVPRMRRICPCRGT